MLSIALVAGITLAFLYVVRHVQTYLELRDFGGHWSAGWTRVWLLRCHLSGEMNKRFTTINDKYGACLSSGLPGRLTDGLAIVNRCA